LGIEKMIDLNLSGAALGTKGTSENKTNKPFQSKELANSAASQVGLDLNEGMLEANHMQKPKSWKDVVVSVLAHTAVVAALILIPLMYTQALDVPKYQKVFLAAPLPPPPPPPPAAVVRPMRHEVLFRNNKLYSPKVIPKHVAIIKEQAEPQEMASGVPGGVIGGVPGGQLGGVLGGILGGRASTMLPPPPKPVRLTGPVRVGGRIQAPRLVYRIQPTYPPLAREARVSGDVLLDCVIDTHGNVTPMKVISGPPLLIQAATSAVSQWRYQPTLLNGIPVAVEMVVTVHFSLGED
jgi:periplasmic protein TonB